jgi:hypothetical protein
MDNSFQKKKKEKRKFLDMFICIPFIIFVGPTDCIVEGEVLKLGGPFLQTWQKKHLKLYPNRLEFYHKNRDGQVVRGKGVEVVYLFITCLVILNGTCLALQIYYSCNNY